MYILVALILLPILIYSGTSYSQDIYDLDVKARCERISIPLCRDIQYNFTIMPNLVGHRNQDEAGLEVHQFYPLVKVNCSAYLKVFLCATYAPVCTDVDEPIPMIPPCRSLCNKARRGCEELMEEFGFTWPDPLQCSRFPENNGQALCVDDDNEGSGPPPTYRPSPSGGILNRSRSLQGSIRPLECAPQYSVNPKMEYKLPVSTGFINNCGMACFPNPDLNEQVFFNNQERNLLRYWIMGWSALCVFSTLFTVLTFVIDRQRFRYPEQPIIFISGCYTIIAAVYLIGAVSNNSVACFNPDDENSVIDSLDVTIQGTDTSSCSVMFMLLYFFTMASSIWWVMLTLTWFLAAGMKWSNEAIDDNAMYFHLAAWALPAIKTIAIIAMEKVDGDVMSGVCYTGISDVNSLRGFVIAPLLIYFLLGATFLLAGFVSLFRIRTVMKHEGSKTDKLEKLMVRIGIFSVLYTVPALVIIGCYFYEQSQRYEWNSTWQALVAQQYGLVGDLSYATQGPKPIYAVFFIKHFMLLVVGVVSGFWIWTGKTVKSWSKFGNKMLCGTKAFPKARV